MKTTKAVVCAIVILLCIHGNVVAQASFNTCAAAFLDGKMVVASYAPDAQAILSDESTGTLTVHEVLLSEEGVVAQAGIPFQAAIRNARTNTLTLWSEGPVRELDITKVLQQCEPGDHIVLLTTGRQWSLPHHELLVQ